jgi:hypothetical protein
VRPAEASTPERATPEILPNAFMEAKADSQYPATSIQQPASSNQLPATSFQQPASSNQLPVTSFQ